MIRQLDGPNTFSSARRVTMPFTDLRHDLNHYFSPLPATSMSCRFSCNSRAKSAFGRCARSPNTGPERTYAPRRHAGRRGACRGPYRGRPDGSLPADTPSSSRRPVVTHISSLAHTHRLPSAMSAALAIGPQRSQTSGQCRHFRGVHNAMNGYRHAAIDTRQARTTLRQRPPSAERYSSSADAPRYSPRHGELRSDLLIIARFAAGAVGTVHTCSPSIASGRPGTATRRLLSRRGAADAKRTVEIEGALGRDDRFLFEMVNASSSRRTVYDRCRLSSTNRQCALILPNLAPGGWHVELRFVRRDTLNLNRYSPRETNKPVNPNETSLSRPLRNPVETQEVTTAKDRNRS